MPKHNNERHALYPNVYKIKLEKQGYLVFYNLFKMYCYLFFFSCAVFAEGTQHQVKEQKIIVEFFFRQGCKECAKVKKIVLPKIEKQLYGSYELRYHDLDKSDNYIKLITCQEYFKNKINAPVYIVVNFSRILTGFDDINNNIVQAITDAKTAPRKALLINAESKEKLLIKRVERFTFITVLVAGLIDGINPCVFTTLIFFISLLSVSRVKGSRLLLTGGTYCLACFLAYLALGFGIFNFLTFFSGYSYLRKALELITFIILILFAVISFIDAIRYKLSHKTEQVSLQLPNSLKKKIHSIMRKGLNYRYFLPGVFGIGVLVTVIESVCTGQVYIPTLVMLTKQCGAGIWFFYLLLYNFAFIVPLLIVFVVAWHGTNTLSFVKWSKRQLVYSKIALGMFFVFMAVIILLIK